MQDREQAYEQNVVGLEIAWRDRIDAKAEAAAAKARVEMKWEAAHDAVEQMLLGSERWENVTAADVSDIAHEAADRAVGARVA